MNVYLLAYIGVESSRIHGNSIQKFLSFVYIFQLFVSIFFIDMHKAK